MRTHRWLIACSLSVVSLVSVAGQQTIAPERVDVEDADTLLMQVAGASYRIQLPGIDAPESVMNPKLQRDIGRTGLSADTLLPLGQAAVTGLQARASGCRQQQQNEDKQFGLPLMGP